MHPDLAPRPGPNPWAGGSVKCLDCTHARTERETDPLRWYCAAGRSPNGRVYAPGFVCAETDAAPGGIPLGFDLQLVRPRKCKRFDSGE